jgi:replication-associated recombination protein RarA|tara:strand:+ start:4692 stop:5444 length:753 start_codon:yes stop_codon:yes gene_type:complete
MVIQNREKLLDMVKKNKVPNILFYGPYMSGKELLCRELIKMVYSNINTESKYVLEINCITNNGIKAIKEDIKLFSKQVFHTSKFVNFKTIVLMYAENLTYDSQYSLRRTIEQYNKSCRFILVCENKYKLLSPICSRFAQFYVNERNDLQICKGVDKFNYGKITSILNAYFSKIANNTLRLNDICSSAQLLYNNNFFALEVLKRFKINPNYNNVKLVFPTISLIFKNEVMTIFYLLVIFRNNSKIQIYDYY